MHRIYLAGPITGCSYGEATTWREYAALEFAGDLPPEHPDYIQAFSPLRAKDYLSHLGDIADSYGKHPLSSADGITTRDRSDVMRCDLMFVNFLGARRMSGGTFIEYGWADMTQTPVVTVIDEGNPNHHGMAQSISGFITDDLDEGIAIAKAVLQASPEVKLPELA